MSTKHCNVGVICTTQFSDITARWRSFECETYNVVRTHWLIQCWKGYNYILRENKGYRRINCHKFFCQYETFAACCYCEQRHPSITTGRHHQANLQSSKSYRWNVIGILLEKHSRYSHLAVKVAIAVLASLIQHWVVNVLRGWESAPAVEWPVISILALGPSRGQGQGQKDKQQQQGGLLQNMVIN